MKTAYEWPNVPRSPATSARGKPEMKPSLTSSKPLQPVWKSAPNAVCHWPLRPSKSKWLSSGLAAHPQRTRRRKSHCQRWLADGTATEQPQVSGQVRPHGNALRARSSGSSPRRPAQPDSFERLDGGGVRRFDRQKGSPISAKLSYLGCRRWQLKKKFVPYSRPAWQSAN